MNLQEFQNILSICISTILSVGAIILSFWFYRESNKQNKETALMQADIKNSIEKLEKLYDRTYTDTFGALKTQMDAMQKHIFSSTVGNTNTSEPNQLRFFVLGYVTEKVTMTIDELCKNVTGFKQPEIKDIIYTFHREGIVSFDGKIIKYLKQTTLNRNIDGQNEN
jgi:hypothetical protein